MAGKKLKKTSQATNLALRYPNLPTKERMRIGDVQIKNNIAQIYDPLRIDKMLKNDIIDETQHLHGMQIITLWTIANRPFLKASQYQPRIDGSNCRPNFEFINISRMDAEDKFHKIMSFMSERNRLLIGKICFEEMPAIAAGKSLGLPINSITVYVRDAFDALGNALGKMRNFKKELEKNKQNPES